MHAVLDILFSVPAFVVLACVASLAFEWKGDMRNMMESIDKLRESLKDCTNVAGTEPNQFDTYWITAAACDKIIDEIEREVSKIEQERDNAIRDCEFLNAKIESEYMRLPVDADGVPIHMGDLVRARDWCEDRRVDSFAVVCRSSDGCYGVWHNADELTHVNQRTVEDVLIDAMQFGFSSHAGDDVTSKAREFAAEIRELMEVDE